MNIEINKMVNYSEHSCYYLMDNFVKSFPRFEEYWNQSNIRYNILCCIDIFKISHELLGKTTFCYEVLEIIYARFLSYYVL